MGLSEGYARLECCKPVCEVAQAQMDWALKDREICRPRVCWEEGQPNRGVGQASCDGPSSSQWDGLGGVVSRPKLGLKEGQPIVGATWASFSFRPLMDEPLKEARASFC